jgi:hypothetical protein
LETFRKQQKEELVVPAHRRVKTINDVHLEHQEGKRQEELGVGALIGTT